jgi:hypothetical protein
MCLLGIKFTADQTKIINDPPDSNFLQVVFPAPLSSSASIRCAKRVKPASCAALRVAFGRYRSALALSEAASAGLKTSLERISAAVQAGSDDGKQIQVGAATAYAGELAAALNAEYAAGRALAAVLRSGKFDVRLDARTRQKIDQRLESPNGLPASIVSPLVASGLVADRVELSRLLKSAFGGRRTTGTLADAVSTSRSTAGLTQLWHQLTVYELAAVVRALATQGAIAHGTGDTLLNDLRAALTATTPAARTAAIALFVQHAAVAQAAPAALLTTAAQALG